jgi:hypothetical protein
MKAQNPSSVRVSISFPPDLYGMLEARRGCVVRPWPLANRKREEPVDEAKPFQQRRNIGSRVTREGHARFWERPEVKFLRATRQRRRSIGKSESGA